LKLKAHTKLSFDEIAQVVVGLALKN